MDKGMVKWLLSYAMLQPTILATQSRKSSTLLWPDVSPKFPPMIELLFLVTSFKQCVVIRVFCVGTIGPVSPSPLPAHSQTMAFAYLNYADPMTLSLQTLTFNTKPSTSTHGIVMMVAQRIWSTTSLCLNIGDHCWTTLELKDQQNSEMQTTYLCVLKSISAFKHNNQKEGQLIQLKNSRSQILA